jgi:methionyl-tRNA synthetase
MIDHYVSTAIPYVNGPPHIGFALELVLADVIARHSRLSGRKTYFLTGTDDNSLKNALAAESAGVTPRALVARNAQAFRDLRAPLAITTDDFIGTSTDPRHAPAVERLWHACEQRGDLYRGHYSGWYCVGCERFYAEAELVDGVCPEHGVAPERVTEDNYFFRLSRYQDELLRLIERGEFVIRPQHRANEALALLRQPLADLSVSRSSTRAHGWGIPVPGDPSQVVYVWFDALANYVSAAGYGTDLERFEKTWLRAGRISHVIGKDVLRFHAVYWPAILLSAGLRLPTELLVHGYVTIDGRKIGKSLGNAVAPEAVVDRLGTDSFRYFLLRHIGSHRDGDFSLARFHEVYTHELANQLGNLVSRTAGLARRHGAPRPRPSALADGLIERVDDAIRAFAPHRALDEIWRVIEAANAYVNRSAPWKLTAPTQRDALDAVLGELYGALRSIAVALAPCLPRTAACIPRALDVQSAGADGAVLFPRSDRAGVALDLDSF